MGLTCSMYRTLWRYCIGPKLNFVLVGEELNEVDKFCYFDCRISPDWPSKTKSHPTQAVVHWMSSIGVYQSDASLASAPHATIDQRLDPYESSNIGPGVWFRTATDEEGNVLEGYRCLNTGVCPVSLQWNGRVLLTTLRLGLWYWVTELCQCKDCWIWTAGTCLAYVRRWTPSA